MKPYWTPGNVVEIALPGPRFCYGVALDFPLMGFFDIQTHEPAPAVELTKRSFLFRIWAMKSVIGKRGWPIIGKIELTEAMKERPWFFKQDHITKKITKYRSPEEHASNKEECAGLECAAVWERVHIESRLVDHFENRPNLVVQILALK